MFIRIEGFYLENLSDYSFNLDLKFENDKRNQREIKYQLHNIILNDN